MIARLTGDSAWTHRRGRDHGVVRGPHCRSVTLRLFVVVVLSTAADGSLAQTRPLAATAETPVEFLNCSLPLGSEPTAVQLTAATSCLLTQADAMAQTDPERAEVAKLAVTVLRSMGESKAALESAAEASRAAADAARAAKDAQSAILQAAAVATDASRTAKSAEVAAVETQRAASQTAASARSVAESIGSVGESVGDWLLGGVLSLQNWVGLMTLLLVILAGAQTRYAAKALKLTKLLVRDAQTSRPEEEAQQGKAAS